MRGFLKSAMALLLTAVLLTGTAMAYVEDETVAPGETIALEKSEFFHTKNGDMIPSEVDFDTDNFTLYKKTIKTGANLVKEIKLNGRREEVQIIFKEGVSAAPASRPNVVISQLSVRAKRTVRDSSRETLVQSGDIYEFDGSLSFRVGLESEDWDMDRSGISIDLESGDQKYIRWVGSGDGVVNVSYGSMAYLEGRVYKNDKILYYYSDVVDEDLEDANPSAYITVVNMGNGKFTGSMQVQLLASSSDYIYEYNSSGKLVSATNLKWSRDEDAWVGRITQGKHYVISDTKLRNISGGTTGGNSYDDDDDDNAYDDDTIDNEYLNPNTGGGSNVAVSISAIVAIVSIAIVSIIMSTILAVKKK